MKKIFSLFMLLLAMFLFVGCDKTEDDNNDDNQVSDTEINLEVSEDVNKEVEVSDAAKDAIKDVVESMVPKGEEVPTEQVDAIVTGFEKYFKDARLSNEQIAAVCAIIVEDDLITLMNSSEAPDAAGFKKLVASAKKLVKAVGNDALGLYLYNTQVATNDQLKELVDVNSYVLESRMIMTVLNSMLDSITDADVDTIYNIATAETEPTNAQIASVIDVVEDAVNNIKITEQAWVDYYAALKPSVVKMVNSEMFQAMLDSMVGPEADQSALATMLLKSFVGSAVSLVDIMGKTTYSGLGYVKNVLAGLDEATLNGLTKEIYVYWDEETGEDKYIVEGVEVNAEQYEAAQLAQSKAMINVFYNPYKSLAESDKANMVKFVEESLKVLEKGMVDAFNESAPEGENIDNYKYKGETAELSEVFAALDAYLAAANVEAAEEALGNLGMKALGYAAKYAPLFVATAMGSTGGGEAEATPAQ